MGASPLNGKTGEVMRWLVVLIGAVLASYFTAQSAIQRDSAVTATRLNSFEGEVLRRLDRIENGLVTERQERREEFRDWLNGVDRRTGEPLPLQRAIEPPR